MFGSRETGNAVAKLQPDSAKPYHLKKNWIKFCEVRTSVNLRYIFYIYLYIDILEKFRLEKVVIILVFLCDYAVLKFSNLSLTLNCSFYLILTTCLY